MKPSDLIEKGWSREAYARDKFGDPVHISDPDACKFCVAGALYALYPPAKVIRILRELILYIPPYMNGNTARTITEWNDRKGRTKRQVVEFLRSVGL